MIDLLPLEDGRLAAGARLPSLRRLATRLGVSSFTVVNAYDRLVAQGLIESRPGAGHFARRRSGLVEVADLEGLAESPLSTLGFAMNTLDPADDTVLAGSGFLPPGRGVAGATRRPHAARRHGDGVTGPGARIARSAQTSGRQASAVWCAGDAGPAGHHLPVRRPRGA